MEGCRKKKEELAYAVKEQPEYDEAYEASARQNQRLGPRSFLGRGKRLQAGGADHSIIVFGDAFAAEEATALRAPGGGLPLEMVETAPFGYVIHRLNLSNEIYWLQDYRNSREC